MALLLLTCGETKLLPEFALARAGLRLFLLAREAIQQAQLLLGEHEPHGLGRVTEAERGANSSSARAVSLVSMIRCRFAALSLSLSLSLSL